MKTKLIFGSIVSIAITWLAYALITLCYLSCANVLFYLITHLVFGILFVSLFWLSRKEGDNSFKDEDLRRKIEYEKHQVVERLKKSENEEIQRINTEINELKSAIEKLKPNEDEIKKVYLLTLALSQQLSNFSANELAQKMEDIKKCLDEIKKVNI